MSLNGSWLLATKRHRYLVELYADVSLGWVEGCFLRLKLILLFESRNRLTAVPTPSVGRFLLKEELLTMRKDVYKAEFASEYDTFTDSAILSCVANCAVKFSEVISDESLEKLNNGTPLSLMLLQEYIPEVRGLFEVLRLDSARFEDRTYVDVSTETLAPFTSDDPKPISHIDQSTLTGVSALIPFDGNSAFFGADDDTFSEFTEYPKFLTTYGQGDVIVIRQNLHSNVSGRSLKQAFHLGIGSDERSLLILDIKQPGLELIT